MLELRPTLLGLGVRGSDGFADDVLVAVDRHELMKNCLVDFVAGETFAGARFRSVLLAAGAGVVVVAAAVAVRGHADVRLAALPAAEQPGEQEVGGVATPLRVVSPLGQDRLCLREGELVHQRLVHTVEHTVAPANLPNVGRVVDDPVHRRMPPTSRRRGSTFVAQLLRDRRRAEPLARVQVEHAPHDRRFHRVRNEHALLVRERVAERRATAEPASLLRAAFDSGADAVDDGGMLELGEHRQHLQHHPPRGRAGVERLRR
ncbi:MAG TPA: hypothetical protein VFL66_03155 [Gaiellaceae bacterium]|nr:hypothetical protein [Gaiellaceae bacterium]